MPKSGDLWYYRTPNLVVSNVAFAGSIILDLISFNNLDEVNTRHIMLFDSNKIPPEGTRPLIAIQVGPKGLASYAPARAGRKFTNGLAVALSINPVELSSELLDPTLTYQAEGIFV